jgi:DNA-directed RNA polymerase I, II, and III subunit RPABC5
VVGNKWISYNKKLDEGISAKDALDQLGLKRICCRRIILTHVELIDKLLDYSIIVNSDTKNELSIQVE